MLVELEGLRSNQQSVLWTTTTTTTTTTKTTTPITATTASTYVPSTRARAPVSDARVLDDEAKTPTRWRSLAKTKWV